MQMRNSGGFLGSGSGAKGAVGASGLAAIAGRSRARVGGLRGRVMSEALEARMLLDGLDHPSFPGTFNAGAGDALTLDLGAAPTDPQFGRALTGANQGVSGNISAAGDFFRFVMPGTPGARDFVTVLADTQTKPDGTDLNSTLDSYVEVYRAAVGGDAPGRVVNGYFRVTSGANNGVLSSSNTATPDGWAGFVGTAGTTYYILVRANPAPLAAARTAVGNYTLRVDAATVNYNTVGNLNTTVPAMPPAPARDIFGEGDAPGMVAFRQDDIVYRVTVPNTSNFDSLATVGVIADDPDMLDTHLEVYDAGDAANGIVTTLASDTQAGRLTNAFAAFRAAPGTTYFVRVRADEVAAGGAATGAYSLAIDTSALTIGIDQTTRLAQPDRADAAAPLAGSTAPEGGSSRLFQFIAQGSGTSFISAIGAGGVAHTPERNPGGPGAYPGLSDPAIHLYNNLGAEIAFNDDTNGLMPQLTVSLTGGQRYFVLVEGFDRAMDGGFSLFIEAQATSISTDDHVNSNAVSVFNFQNATPLVWGAPRFAVDGDGNAIQDHSWVATGTSHGRIYQSGDTDLFQFTPQVSTLDQYPGVSGNNTGRALYVGGNFANADRLNAGNLGTGGRSAPNTAIWDADDWWNAGPGDELQGLDPMAGTTNPTSSAINGPIFAMAEWDPDGAGPIGNVLAVGGKFTDNTGARVNLAFRIFAPLLNRFVWAPITAFNPAYNFAANDSVKVLANIGGNLYVGGRFTNAAGTLVNNVFEMMNDGAFAVTALGTGVTGGATPEVRAIAAFDPPMPHDPPDPDQGGPIPDPPAPPDPPLGVYIGGSFTTGGGVPSANLVRFGPTGNPMTIPDLPVFTALEGGSPNGPVDALVVYHGPGMELNGVDGAPAMPMAHAEMIEDRLIVGGLFTNAGGATSPNLASYTGRAPVTTFGYRPNTAWRPVAGGMPGEVRALTLWRPPSVPGTTGDDASTRVVAAGDGAGGIGSGVLRQFSQIAPAAPGLTPPIAVRGADTLFTDGTVRSLHVFTDDDFNVASHQLLYAGGDFMHIAGVGGLVNHVAKLDDQNLDGRNTWTPLKGGVTGLAPGEVAPPPSTVFALSSFDDKVPGLWNRNERPNSRVSIVVSLPTDPITGASDSFLNTQIRIFDSTAPFQLNPTPIYTNTTINPIGVNPSGAIDPASTSGPMALAGATALMAVMPGLWAGEVYYIEVSGEGGSVGRYNISVTSDAIPPEQPDNHDGVYTDTNRVIFDIPDEGQWAAAPELDLSQTGDGRNFDLLTPNGRFAMNGWNFKRTPGTRMSGLLRAERDFLAGIETVNDTDLYQFRASATGTVEIRLSTLNILDQFTQTDATQTPAVDGVFNNSGGGFATLMQTTTPTQKQYNSALDGLLKVFNNDFEQLAVNDDSSAVTGFSDAFNSGFYPNGGLLAHTFAQRDPRIVLQVVAGETYFVQVQASAHDLAQTDPAHVDWRHAAGSYELLINNTESSNGIDDYENHFQNADLAFSSAIPTDIRTGDGLINGVIDNVMTNDGGPQNPDDTDLFSYIAVSRGTVRVTVTPTNPALRVSVTVYDSGGNQAGAGTGVGDGGPVTVTLQGAQQGARFYISVDGDGITEGSYAVAVDGVGRNDPLPALRDHPTVAPANPDGFLDYAKDGDWTHAQPLGLNAFLGQYSASGVIENPDDADTFTFHAQAYEVGSVTVTTGDSSMDPFVYVWEINANNEDPANRINEWRLIAANNNGPGGGVNSFAQFSVTAGHDYFVVVRGAIPDSSFGRYTLTVNVTPSDDHPNFVDFPLATQLDLSASFNPLNGTAGVTAMGTIEVASDDDVFRFVAPSTGRATVSLTTPASGLAGDLFVYDAGGGQIAHGVAVNGSASVTINIVGNQQYYVKVIAGVAGAGQPDLTGSYTLSVNTSPVDDFANQGQFGSVTPPVGVIVLSATTGVGAISGVVLPDPMVAGADTDLFRFSTLAAGNVQVRVTTVGSTFSPKFTVFDAAHNPLSGGVVNGDGDTATLVFPATAANQTFFVLIAAKDLATGAAAVGAYTLTVTGTRPGGGGGPGTGPDDHANAGEFNSATLILPDARTGFGSATGIINFGGDTDLFQFVASADGPAGVQVKTPSGGLVDGRVRVFNKSFVEIASDAAGIPGATAAVNFTVAGAATGDRYYILVEPVGTATGSYVVELSTQPVTHFLYYPEGFAGTDIDEFLPIVNTNSFPVTYQVYARYETGAQRLTPISTGTIAPSSRGGITVSNRTGMSLVDRGRPYALEIQSSGQLGATLSHYGFGSAIGEAFTDRLSTSWTFSQVDKDRTTYRDFMLFYNPNGVDATLSISLIYNDGTVSNIQQVVPAGRRGGINFDADNRILRNGRFGVQVSSSVGIVSALSVYNLSNSGGDGLLGDADGGVTAAVIPNISSGGGVASTLSFLNTNTSPATVTVTASYARVDLPNLVRVINVPAMRQLSITLADLGLINSQPAGLRYTSNIAVTGSVIEYQDGDGDSSAAATVAARELVFGDLFVNPTQAGTIYKARLGLFNPSPTAIDITVRFLFTDGSSTARVFSVAAGNFGFVQIDQQPEILNHGPNTAFSIDVTSSTPIVASLLHYNLFLAGGWSTLGAPIGLTNPISSLI